jgi:hypothetical protein
MSNFIVKPDMGVLLNYFSATLPNFLKLPDSQLWREMKRICRNGKATFETFYLFGAFDILNLGISSDVKKLDDMQIKPHQEIKGVMDYFIHYGIVASLYPGPFDFKDAVNQNPLIGIITIKVRSTAWDEIYERFNNIDLLKRRISVQFKNAIKKTKNECSTLNSNTYKALLLLSYDCEDVIIVLFTGSFQFIKRFTTNIRTLELPDIHPELSSRDVKHIIASTNTILGMNLKSQDNTLIIPQVYDNKFDKINWITLFEVRPGHLQHAKNAVFRIAKKSRLKLHINPLVGRNDLIVYPKETSGCDLNVFLETHYKLINGLSRNKSIESSETYISFPELDKVESKRGPKKISSDARLITTKLTELIKKIEESSLNKLERESFIQIVRKLAYLLEDRYLHDSFITLYPVVSRAIRGYLNLEMRNTGATLETLTGFIELCYATRYQGSPPIGETAVYPTLGYYSLGQKVLILLDYLGNWIIKNFAEQLTVRKFLPQYIATINMNCPAGTCVPIAGIDLSFIFLPPRPIFHPEILLTIFSHELGHVICKSLIAAKEIKKRLESNPEVMEKLRRLEDLIAEFFSAKMLSNLDFDKYEKNVMRLCLKSFEFKGTCKKYMEDMKKEHIAGAKKLLEFLNDSNTQDSKKAIVQFSDLLKIDDLFISKRLFELLQFIATWQVDEVINRVRIFLSSTNKQKEFWNLWILLNSQRGECYYSFSSKSSL